MIYPTNYIIYNDDFKTKYLRPLKPKKYNYNQIKLLLVNRKINISNLKAKNILEKYNYSKELGNIFKDTIQLTNYQQFKKDFPEIFDELNAVGDSLIITTREGDSKVYHSKAYPIKWWNMKIIKLPVNDYKDDIEYIGTYRRIRDKRCVYCL